MPKKIEKSNKKKTVQQEAQSKQGVKKKTKKSDGSLFFPKGFLWGTATSSHQVEGDNIHNDWWLWEQRKGNVWNEDRSGKAADHYNRYEEDFDLAQSFNNNAHRLSIEWSRIQPEPGKWDQDEIEHYRDVIKALKKRKMKVMLTLHHFTNPEWFAKQGGWENVEAPKLFAVFAQRMTKEYGKDVDFWVTFNEPVILVLQCYINALWPPQRRSLFAAYKAFKNMAKAHKQAYFEIHKQSKKQKKEAQVGMANNMISIVSYHNKMVDYLFMRINEFLWNEYFYKLTKNTHDYLGLNYYLYERLYRTHGKRFKFVDARKTEKRDASDLGWEIFAPGIFEALIELKKYNRPVIITENGLADEHDEKRARFIVAYLKELYHAIQAGVDVRGYFHWSLLDNFEWEKGFEPRFGLVEVDYKTLKRKARPSASVYAQICGENKISPKELRYLGYGVKTRNNPRNKKK